MHHFAGRDIGFNDDVYGGEWLLGILDLEAGRSNKSPCLEPHLS